MALTGANGIASLGNEPPDISTFTGARNTGKNLNMLGGRNLINEGDVRINGDTLTNSNNLGIMNDYRT